MAEMILNDMVVFLKRATGIGYKRFRPFPKNVIHRRYVERLDKKTAALCQDLMVLEKEIEGLRETARRKYNE